MEETQRYGMSTTMNNFNSHPSTRCTHIQVDSDSTRNLSISSVASTKIILQKEATKRCDISTTTNDFNSHPSTRCTRIQVDSDSNRNLSLTLSLSKVWPTTKLMLQKEETQRYDMSTTTNNFSSHPSKRYTHIQVDSDSTRNLSISL